jgi:hypothetical protein
MLEPSTTKERLGCLGSIGGMLLGDWLGLQQFAAHARQQVIDNPDAVIDGTPALAAMGLAALCGLFAGALVGMSMSRLVHWEMPPPDRPKPRPRKDL